MPHTEHAASGGSKSENCKSCLSIIKSIDYLPTYQMLVLSLKTGETIISKLSNAFEISNCVVVPAIASLKKNQTAQ